MNTKNTTRKTQRRKVETKNQNQKQNKNPQENNNVINLIDFKNKKAARELEEKDAQKLDRKLAELRRQQQNHDVLASYRIKPKS